MRLVVPLYCGGFRLRALWPSRGNSGLGTVPIWPCANEDCSRGRTRANRHVSRGTTQDRSDSLRSGTALGVPPSLCDSLPLKMSAGRYARRSPHSGHRSDRCRIVLVASLATDGVVTESVIRQAEHGNKYRRRKGEYNPRASNNHAAQAARGTSVIQITVREELYMGLRPGRSHPIHREMLALQLDRLRQSGTRLECLHADFRGSRRRHDRDTLRQQLLPAFQCKSQVPRHSGFSG
jgi:hypothetical protein